MKRDMKHPDNSENWNVRSTPNPSPSGAPRGPVPPEGELEGLSKFELDAALNRLLRELPDAPLSSNFTTQVMRLIERGHENQSRWQPIQTLVYSFTAGWGRKLAFASIVFLLGTVSYRQYQATTRRELARSVLQISTVLPGQELIGDFNAIDGLRRVSLAQSEESDLLDALQ